MRHAIMKAASFALLAGALVLPTAPASATTATATTTAAPFSVFDVRVKAPKTAKAGGKLSYRVIATNKGPHEADAWFVGGQFPKGVDLKKIRYSSSVPGAECTLEGGRTFFCVLPQVLEKGDSATLVFDTKLTKKAKGTQKALLGVVSFDVQQGMEDLSMAELERLGIKSHAYLKQVSTTIKR